MDFLTKNEMNILKNEIGESSGLINSEMMELKEELKSKWAEEIDDFFSDVAEKHQKKTYVSPEKKRNFWERLIYLFTGV